MYFFNLLSKYINKLTVLNSVTLDLFLIIKRNSKIKFNNHYEAEIHILWINSSITRMNLFITAIKKNCKDKNIKYYDKRSKNTFS